jgi:hypothetical protein
MSAPVPKNLKADGEAVYHEELAKLIKPLIRHAIRYWEMTLMFIERTGMKTSWAEKTKEDLARVRALLLEQPPGEGGLPPSAAQPAVAPTQGMAAPAAEPASASALSAPAADKPAPSKEPDAPPREPSSPARSAAKQVQ